MTEPGRKPTVTVFGAGITGLTAAHELAVRGFKVTVVDKDINEWIGGRTLDPGIGGLARSQFFYRVSDQQPAAATATSEQRRDELIDIPGLRPVPEVMYDDRLVFQQGLAIPRRENDAATFFDNLRTLLFKTHPEWIADPDSPGISLRFWKLRGKESVLAERMEYVRHKIGLSQQIFDNMANPLDPETLKPEPLELDWVTVITPQLDLFPGEHGFRFFPSFYRHLFDTMKRTPILDPKPSETTFRTVFDNLVPVDSLGFAGAGKTRSFTLPRHPVPSFETVREYLRLLTKELGYSLEDLARFELMLFKYMTSCSERRERDYENMTWSEFVDLPRYSAVFREHLEYGPQMMVALRGSKSDARTQGNIVTQLLRDQLVASQHPDATLDGPTSSAWFRHWRNYLATLEVEFRRGVLVDLEGHEASPPLVARIVPKVSYGGPPVPEDSDYFVLAFSLQQMVALVPKLECAARDAGIAPELDDLRRIREFAGVQLQTELAKAEPDGPLQHLAGIQFYFDTEVKFWRGHTQYLDSRWGLTSISQPQFWARFRNTTDAYKSVLSVDIGIWNRSYTKPTHASDPKDDAWSLSADQIARLTWAQIRDHHDDAFYAQYGKQAKFPRPIAYALDQNIAFPENASTPKQNHAAYLVAAVGKYRSRPGALSDGKRQPKGRSSYELIGQIALAGTHMQTFTRLTSMEAANESARHAVNAILDETGAACDRCEIWDPEDNELADLVWFKDLDRELFARGLPHFVDTLRWSELPAQLPRDVLRFK